MTIFYEKIGGLCRATSLALCEPQREVKVSKYIHTRMQQHDMSQEMMKWDEGQIYTALKKACEALCKSRTSDVMPSIIHSAALNEHGSVDPYTQ